MTQQYCIISSHIELIIQHVLTHGSLKLETDEDQISALLKVGYVELGKTLVKYVFKLKPNESIKLTKGGLTVQANETDLLKWQTESLTYDYLEYLLALLKKAILNYIESGVRYIAVSGGCDSRLVLSLIPNQYKKDLVLYTKVNQAQGESNDKDSQYAEMVSKKLNFPQFIKIKDPLSYESFLDPELDQHQKVISGLYGGEFLGGVLNWLLPDELEANFNILNITQYSSLFFASMNSSRTILHKRVTGSWASPYTALNYTVSPFLDFDFLDALVKLKISDILNYKAYDMIWKSEKFKLVSNVGFKSGIGVFYPHYINERIAPSSPKVEYDMQKIAKQNSEYYLNKIFDIKSSELYF